MQSKTQTMIEVVLSTVFAFVIAMLTQAIVFPFYGLEVTFSSNFQITLIFTIVSMVRSYRSRRFFNHIWRKK